MQPRGINIRRPSELTIYSAVAAAAVLVGLLVTARVDAIGPLARPEFGPIVTLPVAVYPVAALSLLVVVLLRNHWWAGLALFFAWLPLEDLVRKFAANDLRVYFVKDVLLGVALIGMLPRLRGCWRRPLGAAWAPTVIVFAFAALLALPAAAIDPALPIVAFHTRFLFVLLLPVGVYLARDSARLETAMFWLAILAAAVCLLGIVQAVVGPDFLNPAESSLKHLAVAKGFGEAEVLRPSGPFTDVSRFASMTIVGVVLGLCSFRLAQSFRRRQVSVIAVGVCVAAAFASASRTSLLVSLPILGFSVLLPYRKSGRSWRTTIASAFLILLLTIVLSATSGESVTRTAQFYASTVDPRSSTFELGSRAKRYALDARAGLQRGLLGRGTGAETLGAQYLQTGYRASGAESGFASVGIEWGFVGLLIWLVWTGAWLRRAFSAISGRHEAPSSPTGVVVLCFLVAFLVVMFSLGIGFFENYIANVFFWLLSGVAFAATDSSAGQATRSFREQGAAIGSKDA